MEVEHDKRKAVRRNKRYAEPNLTEEEPREPARSNYSGGYNQRNYEGPGRCGETGGAEKEEEQRGAHLRKSKNEDLEEGEQTQQRRRRCGGSKPTPQAQGPNQASREHGGPQKCVQSKDHKRRGAYENAEVTG